MTKASKTEPAAAATITEHAAHEVDERRDRVDTPSCSVARPLAVAE